MADGGEERSGLKQLMQDLSRQCTCAAFVSLIFDLFSHRSVQIGQRTQIISSLISHSPAELLKEPTSTADPVAVPGTWSEAGVSSTPSAPSCPVPLNTGMPLIWQGGLLLSIFPPSLPQLAHLISAALPLPGPPLPQPSHRLVLQRHRGHQCLVPPQVERGNAASSCLRRGRAESLAVREERWFCSALDCRRTLTHKHTDTRSLRPGEPGELREENVPRARRFGSERLYSALGATAFQHPFITACSALDPL
ncbi:hypothetical protein SRHO_G00341620 [Serrasalmus rhombeus]